METVKVTIELPKDLYERIQDKSRRMKIEQHALMVSTLALMNPENTAFDPAIVPSTGQPIDLTNEQIYELIGFP